MIRLLRLRVYNFITKYAEAIPPPPTHIRSGVARAFAAEADPEFATPLSHHQHIK